MNDAVRPRWPDVAAARTPALLRLAVMLTGNRHDAEDLVQATMLKVHRHGERIARMDAPAAYLRTALVREHISAKRRKHLRVQPWRDGDDTPADSADSTSEHVALRDATWQLLATLPRQQRAVLALRYYEDLDDVEIAAVLGCAAATVRSHAARGLATLRDHLRTQGEDCS